MLRSLTATMLALFVAGTGGSLAVAAFQGTPDATEGPEPALTPVVWQWTALELADGTTTAPDDPAKYTIQFRPDGRYDLRIDCNGGGGEYTVEGSSLQLGVAMTTLIACPPGTLDTVFLPPLDAVVSFAYDADELVLTLADAAGTMRFAPALVGVVWQWQGFEGGDGSVTAPDDPARYTVQFLDDGSLLAQVDCNSGQGTYSLTDGQIDISQLATTLMACPADSLDAEFARYLDEAVGYVFREGKLYLALPADAGIAEFAATVIEEEDATPTAG
jgi:heat shock protein HslJ